MSSAIGLVAAREIRVRLQQRAYRISLGVVLLIAVIACVLPSLFSSDDGPTKYDVAVTADSPALAASLARSTTPKFTVHRSSAEEARKKVRDGDWDAAVLSGNKLLAGKKDDAVVAAVQAVNRGLLTVNGLQKAGLTNSQISEALDVTPLSVSGAESSQTTQRTTIALVTVVLLFSQLITFCTWAATGVVEEKASRVVELVLSSVRPVQLLTGKLLGIGALAAGQVLLIGAVAMAAATISGTVTIPASGIAVVLVGFISFVLGFAFFGALAAALGSTVSRQEEVGGVLAPVTIALMACYGAGFSTAYDPESTLSRVLSILPPISAIAMPGRIAHGGVPVLDIVLAIVLLLAASAGIVAVAARVYRASVLHSGTRVSLRRAWHGEAVGDLA